MVLDKPASTKSTEDNAGNNYVLQVFIRFHKYTNLFHEYDANLLDNYSISCNW